MCGRLITYKELNLNLNHGITPNAGFSKFNSVELVKQSVQNRQADQSSRHWFSKYRHDGK